LLGELEGVDGRAKPSRDDTGADFFAYLDS
jgi:hypothetical protein